MPQVFFSDLEDRLIEAVQSAAAGLQIAVCWITHPALFRVLLAKCRAGVAVEVLVNFDNINFHPGGLDWSALEAAGARVYGYLGHGLMHHKFAVLDGRRVLTGSCNWTRAAQRDHILYIDDAALAQDFQREFERLLGQGQPLAVLRGRAPRATAFAQLFHPAVWSADDVRRRIVSRAGVWLAGLGPADHDLWQRSVAQQRHFFPCADGRFWAWQGRWDPAAFRQWLEHAGRVPRRAALRAYCLRVQAGDVVVAVQAPGRLLGVGIVGSDPEPGDASQFAFCRYVQWLTPPRETTAPVPAPRTVFQRFRGSALRMLEEFYR